MRNSAMDALIYSETFAGFAAGSSVTADAMQTVVTAVQSPAGVQVLYDASTGGYTIVAAGRGQTFLPADVVATDPREAAYRKTSAAGVDDLALMAGDVRAPSSAPLLRYVRLGVWQRTNGATINQDTVAYGVRTTSAGVPRTGQAAYATDVFGYVTKPNLTRRTIRGSGVFNVDFAAGAFKTTTSVVEYDLGTGGTSWGGGVTLVGSGHLDGVGGFTGTIAYANPFDRNAAGPLEGGFFGPGAEELGLSFTASGPGGAVMTGAMVGRRDATLAPATLTLTNIVADTNMRSTFGDVHAAVDTAATPPFRSSLAYTIAEGGQVTMRPDGSITVRPYWGGSAAEVTTLTAANLSAVQRPNFTSYDTVVDGNAVHIDLFKPGPANTALAMSYASFGTWARPPVTTGTWTSWSQIFFTYGLETDRGVLSPRSGAAHYSGIVQGATMNADTLFKTVGGTSRFDINFSGGTYSGALVLDATPSSGGASVALGTWDFAGALAGGRMDIAPLTQNGVLPVSGLDKNHIRPVFYGPDGQEIGAVFTVNSSWQGSIGSVGIAGATVAKRQ